jgi:hypothetical protein
VLDNGHELKSSALTDEVGKRLRRCESYEAAEARGWKFFKGVGGWMNCLSKVLGGRGRQVGLRQGLEDGIGRFGVLTVEAWMGRLCGGWTLFRFGERVFQFLGWSNDCWGGRVGCG